MDYRPLNNTPLRLSAMGIGGWQTFGQKLDDAQTLAMLRAAFERGVNFIDLADSYGAGAAERAIGACLREFPRERLVLASKVYWPSGPDETDRGLSRARILRQIDFSLSNLNTDYLDLYFCHREDETTPLHETLGAMDELVRAGKVRHWGTSNFSHRSIEKAHRLARRAGLAPPVVEQPCYNLLSRSLERWLLPTIARRQMGLAIWGPLAGGLLAANFENESIPEERRSQARWRGVSDAEMAHSLGKLRILREIAARLGHKPAQLALAWLLSRPHVTSVITGAGSLHLLEDLAAAELNLPNEVIDELSALFPPPPPKLSDLARLGTALLSGLLSR